MSAVRDGGVDLEISKKKRRLNAELESLLDKMQSKQEEFMSLDAGLQSLEDEIEGKEAQVRTIESSFTEALVKQHQAIAQLLL